MTEPVAGGKGGILLEKATSKCKICETPITSDLLRGVMQRACGPKLRVSPVSTSSYVEVIRSFGVPSENTAYTSSEPAQSAPDSSSPENSQPPP